ncbi:von Willebrand factor D and EGF domain-containing protein-like [Mya arenaria]|uniref:von Willebrand factor D and EGF domain-containing protein-like n=2 Tax=Mya arenaria TaxID=6604 RepID=UPI0022E8DD5C|nr:von Willebrand factor D and EGF domain-containing protein-like [Mya arenaria]
MAGIYFMAFFGLIHIARGTDPCTSAQLIDEPLRSTGYTAQNPSIDQLFCDRQLAPGWYKFNGGLKLATTCQTEYHCNTHLPMWMNGTHPAALGTIVTNTICAIEMDQGCCSYQSTVNVTNCGTFFAYELEPAPGCHMSYCAGSGTPCLPHQTSATGLAPGCYDKFPQMLSSPHLSNPILTPGSFKFQCDINFDHARRDVGFDVQFLFDDKPDRNVPPVHITDGVTRHADLNQNLLKGHMGQNVSCAVRTFFLTPPKPGTHFNSTYIPSNIYWIGIKTYTNRLVVGENENPKTVSIYSTVPIRCPPQHAKTCNLEIELDPINNNGQLTLVKDCNVHFTPAMWNPKTNRATTTFHVSATRDGKADKDIFLHFNPIYTADASPIFNKYQVPLMQILTKDKNTSTCSCTDDPHCRTLDTTFTKKGSYLDYYLIGEFTMYNSTTRDFQVQVRTWKCNHRVSCNCGVAMKEGNNVVILDMCHTQYGTSFPRIVFPNNSSHRMVVNRDKAGNSWTVSFPSGAQVKVTNSRGVALNVHITAPEVDFSGTEGLCGFFDGNRDNDLTYPTGKIATFPTNRSQNNNFVESWRIPVGDSFFDKTPAIDPKLNRDMYYCKCDQKVKGQVTCSIDGNTARPAVYGELNPANGRRRRAASTTLPDDYPADYYFDYGLSFQPQLLANFPSVNGKSRAEAENACNSAIDNNPTLQQCIAKAGLDFSNEKDICIEDFKYFDNGELVRSALHTAIYKCIDHVLRNVSLHDTSGNPPAYVTSELCPDYDCNDNGACANGTCICNHGFVGDSCEINSQKAPMLYGVISTSYIGKSVLCDVTDRECVTSYVHGDNIYDNSRLSCKVRVMQFDGHGFVYKGHTFTTGVVYRSMYDVGCRLPTKAFIGGQTVVGFNISVTNDGHTYSNEITAVRTDSHCANCLKSGTSCTVKPGTCLIEGNCRTAGEVNAKNKNQQCDPTHSQTAWANTQPVTPAESHTVTTPPTAPQGGTYLKRFDIWTFSQSGCQCAHNHALYTCACCDVGGCQCQAPHSNQCVKCEDTHICGHPLAAPSNGVDGYTIAISGCKCRFDPSQSNCACCRIGIGACPCGRTQRNQCAACDFMYQCGNKPWIFGPPMA